MTAQHTSHTASPEANTQLTVLREGLLVALSAIASVTVLARRLLDPRPSARRGLPSTRARLRRDSLAMTGPLDLVVAAALLASAYIQGLSGVGFSLIAAPVITQAMPGASAIGLVNLLALSQNSFMIWREDGDVRWPIIRRLLPGLVAGVVIGLLLSASLSDQLRPLVVAGSSLASLAALLLWKPGVGRGAATVAATWSGAVNSYASVGGPPLAAYLVHLDLEQSSYVRTQQVCFAFLNIASIPFLGLPRITVWWVASAIAVIVVGTVLGRFTRRFFPPTRARQLTMVVIALVAIAAFGRSLAALLG